MKKGAWRTITGLSLVAAALASSAPRCLAADKLVNMVPNNRSGETNQDAEPTLTVDPNNFLVMAGSAFTWDNLTMAPMVTATAPIYVTKDGGKTWALAFIVPSGVGAGFPTGDITLSFGANHFTVIPIGDRHGDILYGGVLSSSGTGRPMTVLRTTNPFTIGLMKVLDTHSGNVDQPHTVAETASFGQDKLYVGFNNGYGCIPANGRTAALDVAQTAEVTTPAFGLDVIEARNTGCQDGFAQVPAAHRDGTVYAAFLHDFTGTPRLVVVRDDHWGTSSPPFAALTDPSDSVAGRLVTTGLKLPSGALGQNRLGASNVSIAVDPRNSDRVYVAWGDSNGFDSETIHLRRSINRGVDWSGDLLTVTSAMNPEVAIDAIGVVGVLYQSVANGNWETRLVRSNDLDAKNFPLPGKLLASQNASTPAKSFDPYLGDYASLTTAGNDFVGIFSASNYPDQANFASGVSYQREVDWTAHKLYADPGHTSEVAPSIDPFFFEISTTVCDRLAVFCEICQRDRDLCYPIYDPWWWLKCPECGIEIFVDPGDEIEQIGIIDSERKALGNLQRLSRPVEIDGRSYRYRIEVKPREGVGYVLKVELKRGKQLESGFHPEIVVRQLKASEAK